MLTRESGNEENLSLSGQLLRARLLSARPGGQQASENPVVQRLRERLDSSETRNANAPYHLAALWLSPGNRAGPTVPFSARSKRVPRL